MDGGTWFSRAHALLFSLFTLSLIGRTRCARFVLYLFTLSLIGRTSNHTRFLFYRPSSEASTSSPFNRQCQVHLLHGRHLWHRRRSRLAHAPLEALPGAQDAHRRGCPR
ncbi:RHTO0S07e03136g1_1 [Rhodotorula toruloides]|uniref:RHTO0S07e03136g1_1 n=2 Tax=Rhodotorula toruloides TaxID=5286 RepID=A0A061AZP3_RHOTO|nr:uncharacterized protein RHTO_02802 [Rhodotorula toruloides NP11]EMS25075.1 hypothetical protein RHTO_02802 [Rhodotorula toruloides NP11]CDR42707.1 RHTO0S07e03136g1_1 [Rhodotorula toruloides]